MLLLPHRDLRHVRHLFGAEHLGLVIDAVIAGNSPARVWADDLVTPRTALAWDGAHCLYLVGAAGHGDACRELFEREIAPAGRGMFMLYGTEAAAGAVVAGQALRQRERVLYRGDRLAVSGWPQRMPAGFRISAISDQLPELRMLGNFAQVAAEIGSCWNSMADFRRAGFGFCAHDAGTIVCWCTAEYVSDGRCGIGIETVAACRGRGFATLTASAFAEHCAERRVVPHWDAWSDNLPSVAVAEKLGFRKIESYSVFVGRFGGTQAAQ
jgi:RimJ/RimL family protein N-acetyltransferase